MIKGLVVARGAASALVLGAPAALANVVLADQDPKPTGLLNLTLLVLLVAFAVGGFVAGLEAPERPVAHGARAGAAAAALAQLIGIAGRLDRGDPVSIGAVALFLLLGAGMGALGARAGAARRRTRPPEVHLGTDTAGGPS